MSYDSVTIPVRIIFFLNAGVKIIGWSYFMVDCNNQWRIIYFTDYYISRT